MLSQQAVITSLLKKYESRKAQLSLVQFCKDHDMPVGIFYTFRESETAFLKARNKRRSVFTMCTLKVADYLKSYLLRQ